MTPHQTWVHSGGVLAEEPEYPEDRSGQVLLACGAAFCLPGLGHLILGRWILGLCWLTLTAGAAGISALFQPHPQRVVETGCALGIAILVYAFQFIDAARCARARLSPVFSLSLPRYALGVIFALGALFWQRAAISALQEHAYELGHSPTPSMSPAIKADDLFLHMKGHPVRRWDLAGASMPRTSQFPFPDLVKRVVGLPGETIELTGSGLLINGKPVEPPPGVSPYRAVDVLNRPLYRPDRRIAANGCWGRPITLGPDEYFLLGDNALMSHDARLWPSIDGRQPGAMPARRISGRVAAIVWPPERWRLFARVPTE